MTTATKCRAKDPATCTDPNCPEKRAHAARVAAFMAHPSQGGAKARAAATLTPMSNTKQTLTDIAPADLWASDIAERFIDVQHHPTLPLDIYNYSQSTQFSRHWNPATLAARGLIVDRESGEVVSRPFGKFFNWGEQALDQAALSGPIRVTDKADGSLAISYPTPDGLAIATRGSFASEQALHATAILRERYAGAWQPRADRTYLWEIIYPTNRIVLDYGAKDDIMLLGAVNTATGRSIPAAEITEWPGERVQEFEFADMTQVLAAAPRPNAEGYVVQFTDTDARVKIKQEDYVRLHRIMTGVNAKRVWEVLVEGRTTDEFLQNVPEEFEAYVRGVEKRLKSAHARRVADADEQYAEVVAAIGPDTDQKTFALHVLGNYPKGASGLLFSLRKGDRAAVDKAVWRAIEPEYERPFFSQSPGAD